MTWQSYAAELIREADPSFRDPIYLVDAAAARYTLPKHFAGFTNPACAYELRSVIPEWNGYGFCAVIDPRLFPDDLARTGAAIHEFCHYLDTVPMLKAVHDRHAMPFSEFCEEMQEAAEAAESQPPREADVADVDIHGPKWLRICIHLAYRIDFSSVHLGLIAADERNGDLTRAACYVYEKYLGAEPQERRHEDLAAIAISPMPPAYAKFAAQDLARAKRSTLL